MKRKSIKHIYWEIQQKQNKIDKLQKEIDELNDEKSPDTSHNLNKLPREKDEKI